MIKRSKAGNAVRAFIVVLFLGLAAPAGAADRAAVGTEVDLELVLAVDVSGSVDYDEGELQRKGFIEAFRNPAVIRAIKGGRLGRIAVIYVEWAGPEFQFDIVGWHVIDSAESANAFADRLAEQDIDSALWTSISAVMDFAVTLVDTGPYWSKRRVLDISGDGANNAGELVTKARDRAITRGLTINGLPIVNNRPSPWGLPQVPNLDWYFEDCVIGGPNAFIVVANGFEDFGRAIRRKLIREIAGLEAPAPRDRARGLTPAALPERPPCDAGERMLRRFGADP